MSPDLVINYAIPITWDATKRLPNYARVSAAGLGAFTPLQVCAPLTVGRAIAASSAEPAYMVVARDRNVLVGNRRAVDV